MKVRKACADTWNILKPNLILGTNYKYSFCNSESDKLYLNLNLFSPSLICLLMSNLLVDSSAYGYCVLVPPSFISSDSLADLA